MKWQSRLRVNTLASVSAVLLSLFALGFAGVAAYLGLSAYYGAEMAAWLTAVIYLLLAVLVLIVAKIVTRLKTNRVAEQKCQPEQDFELILEKLSDSGLLEVIKKHPGKSIVTTLAAGALVGYSSEVRSLLKTAAASLFDEPKE